MSNATNEAFDLNDILHALSSGMRYPVVIILILFILCAVALIGWIIAEYITERRHMKPALSELLEAMKSTDDIKAVITESGLLARQKDALLELCSHPSFSSDMLEALAIRLMDAEQSRYDRIVHLSELLSRLAPMFGLLGTLIPLGPGIIALGQGDTYTLSVSLLTAFDTTVAGLIAAAAATVISTIRRQWYREYLSILELCCQCILERKKEEEAQ